MRSIRMVFTIIFVILVGAALALWFFVSLYPVSANKFLDEIDMRIVFGSYSIVVMLSLLLGPAAFLYEKNKLLYISCCLTIAITLFSVVKVCFYGA